MVKKMLVTRPRHDVATEYLYEFSKEVIKRAKQTQGVHVTDLAAAQANRTLLEKR